MSKRILLIGNGNSQFVFTLALWLKRTNPQLTVDLFSIVPVKESFKKNFDQCYSAKSSKLIEFGLRYVGLRMLTMMYLNHKLLKQIHTYDVVHFQFISPDKFFLINHFHKKTNSKIILSIWGSDLYKIPKSMVSSFEKHCRIATSITFTNEKTIAYFKQKFQWEKDNLKLCRFGLAPLEELKKLALSKEQCKEELAWTKGKIAITIGYNLSPNQQHLKILEVFKSEELKKLKNQILLIFPITYAGSSKYKNQILNELNELPFEYKIYDTFMSDERVAKIRKASDMMLQLQQTDQFSGSMQEHLYTQNIVITGSWLPYETLIEEGVWFKQIDAIRDLAKSLLEVIENYEDLKLKTQNNPEAILKLSSWEKNIGLWSKLYE